MTLEQSSDDAGGRSWTKRKSFGSSRTLHYWFAGVLLVFLQLVTPQASAAPRPQIVHGELDLSKQDLGSMTPLPLAGDWQFYWHQLLTPEMVPHAGTPGYFPMSCPWEKCDYDGKPLPADGVATYRLHVKLPPGTKEIGVKFPFFLGWAKIFLNGVAVHELGSFHGIGKPTYPGGVGYKVYQQLDKPELEIVIQTANFGTALGGTFDTMTIGGASAMSHHESLLLGFDAFLISALMFMTAYHVLMFIIRRKESSTIWFAVFCLSIAVRVALVGGGKIAYLVFGLPPLVSWRIEMICYHVAIPVLASFINRLFPAETNRYNAIFAWTVSGILAVTTIFAPSTIFQPALGVMQLLNIYCMGAYGWALVQAAKHGRDGAKIFLGGFALMCLLSFIEIIAINKQIEMRNLSSIGVYIFTLCQSIVLAKRFNNAFIQVEADEQRIHKLNDELKANAESRSRFFHNTSHELRTPLHGILGFGQMIRQGTYGPVPHKVGVQVEKIETLAESLMHQVNNILDLAKSRRGELRLVNTRLSLDDFAAEVQVVAEGLANQAVATTFTLTKSWDKGSNAATVNGLVEDELHFIGDREKLLVVARNLIGNAFKFSGPTRPNHVSLHLTRLPDEALRLTVQDTGIGIAPEHQETIFAEFEQVEQDARRSYEGNGLGLTMVKDLVVLMQGTIKLESAEDSGSIFTITIPNQPASALSQVQFMSVAEALALTAHTDEIFTVGYTHEGGETRAKAVPIPQPYRILVVDDNAINCEVISDILTSAGYPLSVAYGGADALKQAVTYKPDLVLLDLMMPEVSGEDVIQAMKTDRDLGLIPIIVLTARASQEDRLSALDLGADDYLAKPLVADELLLRVKNTLSRLSAAKAEAQRGMLEKSLMQAQAVHSSLGAAGQKLHGVSVASHYKAAEMAGGDWFGFNYDERRGRVYLLIADVTGHDMLSALVTVAAAGAFKGAMASIKRLAADESMEQCLELVAEILNDAVRDAGQVSAKLMTLALLAIDVRTGTVAYANAGHTPVLHVAGDQVKVVLRPANPLGLDPRVAIGAATFQLGAGDGLFAFTDGLLENTGPVGQKLGLRNLKRLLLSEERPEAVLKQVLDSCQLLWQQQPPEDDCSFIFLKWDGPELSQAV